MNQLNEEIESHLSLQKTAMTKIFNIEIKYMKESNEDLRVQLHFKEKQIKKLVGLIFRQECELYKKRNKMFEFRFSDGSSSLNKWFQSDEDKKAKISIAEQEALELKSAIEALTIEIE